MIRSMLVALAILPTLAFSQSRIAILGDSLNVAKQRYADATPVPRVDCDPVGDGRWVCASFDNPTLADAGVVVTDRPSESSATATIDNLAGCLASDASTLRSCLASSRSIALAADITLAGCPALTINDRRGVAIDGRGHTILRTGGHRRCSLIDIVRSQQIGIKDLVLDDDARVGACTTAERCPRMVHVRDSESVGFRRVEVLHSKGYAFYTDRVTGFRFADGAIRRSGVLGLYIGHADGLSTDAVITGNTFSDNASNALAVLGAKGVLIEGNRFERNHLYGRFPVAPQFGSGMTGGGQLYVARGQELVIRDNTITDGRCVNCVDHGPVLRTGVHGIELSEPGKSDAVKNIRIEGNTITGNDAAGIYVNNGATVNGLSLVGNTVVGNGRDLNTTEDTGNGTDVSAASNASPSVVEPDLAIAETDRPPTIGVVVVGATLQEAISRYAAATSQPRIDCDPSEDGRWICASYANPTLADLSDSRTALPRSEPEFKAATPQPAPTSGAARLIAQAESAAGSGWTRTAEGVRWDGGNRYSLLTRRDDGNLSYQLDIVEPGRYRFIWRARSAVVDNPQEPPNDVWIRFGTVDWTKVFYDKNRTGWQTTASPQNGTSSAILGSGPVTLTVSGRSDGNEIDYVGLERVGGSTALPTGAQPTLDLISLHYDSTPDWDDLQAMVAGRLILDRFPERDFMVVNGTLGDRATRGAFIAGSTEHCASVYGTCLDYVADAEDAITRTAAAWALTLNAGGRVHVAEGGPSDFTADVLRRLEQQGLSRQVLARIDVVQHSHGQGFNEKMTSDTGIAFVKSRANYITIDNGNAENATPDFNQQGTDFEARSLASRYGPQWRNAYRFARDARRVDFSDTVELMHILGLAKGHAPTVSAFADRYF